jgi:hypothetical protein
MVKSYLTKQCREDVNKTFSILQTPHPGAQLDFYESIDRLLDQISNESDTLEPPTVKLKLAAEGVKVSRISSFLVLSLAVLNDGDAVMSSTGQHTLAIVSSDEKYFTIKECFCTIFYQINNLLSQSNGNIVYETKPNKKLRLEIFLGGDMKYLLTVIGMNVANTNFACLYCKIVKENRSDMYKYKNVYWSKEIARTNQEMKLFCSKSKSNFGCIHPPLLNIELSLVVIDQLHLLMRICDVLLRNVIKDSVNLDHKNSIWKKTQTKHCVNELVTCIRNCGVSFSIWENKVKDGRGDCLKNLEWTSFTGSDLKRLLHALPTHLQIVNCIETVSKEKVIAVWKSFETIYSILNSWSPSKLEVDSFFELARKWVLDFRSLSEHLEGMTAKVLPPIFMLWYTMSRKCLKHMEVLSNLRVKVSKKSNDAIKMIYHRKTNKHCAPAEALRVRQRKNMLKQYAKVKSMGK